MIFTSGLPETTCGKGSMLGETVHLRAEFGKLLQQLDVKTLVDAPCGDLNWMSQNDLSGIDYVGIDVDAGRLAEAERHAIDFAAGSIRLIQADILKDPLPPGDAMLCRDFFQHISTPMVMRVLAAFLSSNIPWLLATSHDVETNEEIDRIGGFRRLNLFAEPFSFTATYQIGDPPNSGRILGAWPRGTASSAISRWPCRYSSGE